MLIATFACTAVAGKGPSTSTPSVTITQATSIPPRSGATTAPTKAPQTLAMIEFKVGAGQGPHDVAPAADGGVWYTAQRTGELGWLDPSTGAYTMTTLGRGLGPPGGGG